MELIIGIAIGLSVGYFLWGRQVDALQAALEDALRGDTDAKKEQ